MKETNCREEVTRGCEVFLRRVFDVDGGRLRLGCKADRIGVLASGTLLVTDYKTGAAGRVPTPEYLRSDLPTFIYYLLARACYPGYGATRIVFVNVLSLAHVEVEYDAGQVAANKAGLRECFARILADDSFQAGRCEACAWCAVAEDCSLFSGEVGFDALT